MRKKQSSRVDDVGETLQGHAINGKMDKLKQLAEQESNQIIAKAYEQSVEIISSARQEAELIVLDAKNRANKAAAQESATIIAAAKEMAEQITGEAKEQNMAFYTHLSTIVKSGNVAEYSHERIDDLFVQMRRCLAKATQSDPPTATREMESLVTELEYWVDSLVIDSLKLRSLESWIQGSTELARRLRAKLDRK